jgi:hypothetical protein
MALREAGGVYNVFTFLFPANCCHSTGEIHTASSLQQMGILPL